MPRLTNRRGRKGAYLRKLNTAYWQDVARRVRMRDHHRCRICGTSVNLEVHHLTYYVNGESIVGREADHLDKLITLCGTCHAAQHRQDERVKLLSDRHRHLPRSTH